MSKRTMNWLGHLTIACVCIVAFVNMIFYIYGMCYEKKQQLITDKHDEWHQILTKSTPDELKEIIDFIEKEYEQNE